MNVLKELNPKHCRCSAGSAGKEVGYLCPGTCLDYAYDKLKVPYVFAWEIYDRIFDFRELEVEQMSFLQVNHKGKVFDAIKKSYFSCFMQTSTSTMYLKHFCSLFDKIFRTSMSSDECFDYFNPTNENKYNMVVKNWVNVKKI